MSKSLPVRCTNYFLVLSLGLSGTEPDSKMTYSLDH